MGRNILAVFSGFLWSLGAYAIVGPIPTPIPMDHPGSYNTVAIVKPKPGGKYQIFCSGFIFNHSTIVTAKHCVADKAPESIFVYLGEDTNKIEPRLLLEVQSRDIYGSSNWESFFPSFDVAVIHLKKSIPNFGQKDTQPYFDSVPFLTDPSKLQATEKFHLVGYGNQSIEMGVIVAGEKKHVATGFHRFVDTPQLSSLIVFRGEIGHSNCHGDSGGPAYALVTDPESGQKKWYVVGTTAGFDLALTPDSYIPRDDEDFPFIAKCDQAQTIYSYIGDYLPWIEDLTNDSAKSLGDRRSLPPGEFEFESADTPQKSFQWYCENIQWSDDRWGAVRELMIIATDTTTEYSSDDVFADCELAAEVLRPLTEISFDENSFIQNLEPLASLPNLKSLKVSKRVIPNLSSLKSESLESLEFSEVSGLQDLSFLASFPSAPTIKRLSVVNSNLIWSKGLSEAKNLEYLSLGRNQLASVPELHDLTHLQSLDLNTNQLKDLDSLRLDNKVIHLSVFGNEITKLPLAKKLRVLNARSNLIGNLDVLSSSTDLTVVNLASNQLTRLSGIANLSKIKKLDISNNRITERNVFGDWSHNIVELRISQTEIEDLDFLANSRALEKLYASQTKIASLKPLSHLDKLKTLFLGGTPISMASAINAENCPIEGKNAVAKYCKRLAQNDDLDPSVRWRFH